MSTGLCPAARFGCDLGKTPQKRFPGHNPSDAQAVGQVIGQELSAVGVNLLLGPVVDVLERPHPEGGKGAGDEPGRHRECGA